jgi:regulator of cell morphogenesis and NO signaling
MSIDPSRSVADLVLELPSRARVLEQLGVDYCCGGKRSLADACAGGGVGLDTTLAALESASQERSTEPDWTRASLAELCDHIVSAHHGLLRTELPRLDSLLATIVRVHGAGRPELAELRSTFAGLRDELEEHMASEEERLFPVCRTGGPFDAEQLAELSHEHDATGAALARLREIAQGYDLDQALCNTHRATLDGLHSLERDLHQHIHEENNVLFPRALATA